MGSTRIARKDPARLGRVLAADWRFLLGAFVVAKVVVTGLIYFASVAMELMWIKTGQSPPLDWPMRIPTGGPDQIDLVNIWFRFDSSHYLDTAGIDFLAPLTGEEQQMMAAAQDPNGFGPITPSLRRFTFAPMLPLLTKIFLAMGIEPHIAMLIVVNLAFALVILFCQALATQVLATRSSGSFGHLDHLKARKITAIMLLAPVSFLFQCALTEGLFVLFMLASLYFALRNNWVAAGLMGAGLALTRSTGFSIALPLGLILLSNHGWRFNSGKAWIAWLKALPFVALPGIAWFGFMLYCRQLTGDLFAYTHLQRYAWTVNAENPITSWLFYTAPERTLLDLNTVRTWAVLALVLLVLAGIGVMPLGFTVMGLGLLLAPLTAGEPWPRSIFRYFAVVFPLWFSFGWFTRRFPSWEPAVLGTLAALQGIFIVGWTYPMTILIV